MSEHHKTESKDVQAPVLVFHENCGTNIRLTNCNTTAKIKQQEILGDGVVVSRDAMVVNVLYEVRVDALVGDYRMLCTGVTKIPPARLALASYSKDLEDSINIYPYGIFRQGTLSNGSTLEKGRLSRIQVGNRVGVLVDSSNDLHLYVDGQDLGVEANDVTQPCFALFDLSYEVIQVTALPTSRRTSRIFNIIQNQMCIFSAESSTESTH